MSELIDLSYSSIYAPDNAFQPDRGRVEEIGDGIAVCSGLRGARMHDAALIDGRVPAIVLDLNEDRVGLGVLGSAEDIAEGMEVKLTGELMSASVSTHIAGRILDASGAPLDGLEAPPAEVKAPVFRVSPPLTRIQGVDRPMQTGILAVDSVIPIGKGQRQLILGDRQTGKTQIAIDAIINQRGQGVHCLYVSIGKKMTEVANLAATLTAKDAMAYTTMIAAPADASLTGQFLAPYYAMAVAEVMRERGRDVLVVFDDLSNHADAYRTISLLFRRPPGREAYPGDIFYIHGSLLERAAQLKPEEGGGSITALPIVTTLSDDITAYIPTNIVSITDGQIYLRSELVNQGRMPAVDVGLSVSRVGSDAQLPIVSSLSKGVLFTLSQYAELQDLLMYDNALDEHQMRIVEQGGTLVELFKQPPGAPRSLLQTLLLLHAFRSGTFSGMSASGIGALRNRLLRVGFDNESYAQEAVDSMRTVKTLTDEQARFLDALIELAGSQV